MTRHLERLLGRFLLWFFSLTELPHIDEVGEDCPCVRCVEKRAKRKGRLGP